MLHPGYVLHLQRNEPGNEITWCESNDMIWFDLIWLKWQRHTKTTHDIADTRWKLLWCVCGCQFKWIVYGRVCHHCLGMKGAIYKSLTVIYPTQARGFFLRVGNSPQVSWMHWVFWLSCLELVWFGYTPEDSQEPENYGFSFFHGGCILRFHIKPS